MPLGGGVAHHPAIFFRECPVATPVAFGGGAAGITRVVYRWGVVVNRLALRSPFLASLLFSFTLTTVIVLPLILTASRPGPMLGFGVGLVFTGAAVIYPLVRSRVARYRHTGEGRQLPGLEDWTPSDSNS